MLPYERMSATESGVRRANDPEQVCDVCRYAGGAAQRAQVPEAATFQRATSRQGEWKAQGDKEQGLPLVDSGLIKLRRTR